MKPSVPKPATTPEPPVFPKMMHQLRPNPAAIAASNTPVKEPKKAKPFSKSRDLHEDRGERQIKTSHNSQTFPHGP